MANEDKTQCSSCDTNNNGLSGGQVALIILACLLVIGLIAALIAWLMQSKNKNKSNSKQNIVQIGGAVPQNNVQQPQNAKNQQTPYANQPNTQTTQNNPAPIDTATNQQALIADVVATATPQIMASMAQFAAPDAIKQPNVEPMSNTAGILDGRQDENNVPEQQTQEEVEDNKSKISDDINEEDKKQKVETSQNNSDLETGPFAGFPAGKIANDDNKIDNSSIPEEADILSALPFLQNVPENKGMKQPETVTRKGNTDNKIETNAPKLDLETLFGLRPMPEKTINEPKTIPEEKRNNIIDIPMPPRVTSVGNMPGSPKMNAEGRINMLNQDENVFTPGIQIQPMNNNHGLPIISPNKQNQQPRLMPEQINNQIKNDNIIPPLFKLMPQAQNDNQIIDNNKEPARNDFRIVGGTPEAPSIIFDQNKFDERNEKNAKMFDQLISPSTMMQQPVPTTRMPLPTIETEQKPIKIPEVCGDILASSEFNDATANPFNNKPINNNKEPMRDNIMPFNIMPEQNIQGNNVPDNVLPLPMMESPIDINNVNYNNPLNENIMPIIDASKNTNIAPNTQATLNNQSNFLKTPIPEDDIQSDDPIFGSTMMGNDKPKTQREETPFIMQDPAIDDLPIPGQVKLQEKEQNKNSKEDNDDCVFQLAQLNQHVPIKKENNGPMFSNLPGIDDKPMEANNGQSQMNLGTQNKCTYPSCTGNQ